MISPGSVLKGISKGNTLLVIFTILILSLFVLPKPAISEVDGKRVLFMIAEKNVEETHFYYWWSSSFWGQAKGKTEYMAEVSSISTADTTLKEAFIKAGFHVVDPSSIEGEVEIEDPYRVEDLTIKNTTRFGKAYGTDIVVKGRALARKGMKKEGSNMGVYMADATAQAIRVSDGMVLASASGHGVARHISQSSGAIEALSRAAEDLANNLIEQINARGE
jgi:hypothetical protein